MLAPSELILNTRGAVYHLDLLPEEIAEQIVLVGDPDRVKEVSKHFDRVDFQRQTREFITHTGYIGKKRISVVSTGIGTDNIDIVLNELDALVNIDLSSGIVKPALTRLQFFRVGTSGALQADVPVNSILVSSHGIGLDNLLNFYAGNPSPAEEELLTAFTQHLQLGPEMARPYLSTASKTLVEEFAQYPQGITVTCPGFYGPQGRVLRLGLKNQDLIGNLSGFRLNQLRITNFEMETAGIYGLCQLLGHDAISLNAILANRVTKEFSTDPKAVVAALIEETLDKISRMQE